MPRVRPDFLCIGMQKAGTSFIYQCLENVDAVRLPLLKELHHFDLPGRLHPAGRRLVRQTAELVGARRGADPHKVAARLSKVGLRRLVGRKIRVSGLDRVLDETAAGFVANFCEYAASRGSDDQYLRLFAPYQGHVTGDVTPAYSTLRTHEVQQVHDLLPHARIVLSVRDPVARLWSSLNMLSRRSFRKSHGRLPTTRDAEWFDASLSGARLQERLREHRVMKRSFASRAYETWASIYGPERLLVVHFDDLVGKTEQVVRKICAFLGVTPQSGISLPENEKRDAMKVRLDDARRELLEAALGDELDRHAELFDAHADRI